jgi:hypothetical protein
VMMGSVPPAGAMVCLSVPFLVCLCSSGVPKSGGILAGGVQISEAGAEGALSEAQVA